MILDVEHWVCIIKIAVFLVDTLENVKPQNPVSEKKTTFNHMLEDPHEDLEKLDPLHAQSDTGCNKGQRPLSYCLNMKIFF